MPRLGSLKEARKVIPQWSRSKFYIYAGKVPGLVYRDGAGMGPLKFDLDMLERIVAEPRAVLPPEPKAVRAG